jgi:hypothetical protein
MSNFLDLLPLLNQFSHMNIPENFYTKNMSSELKSINARALLLEILQAFVQCYPTSIIFEDSQFMDQMSLDVFRAAIKRVFLLFIILIFIYFL